MEAIKYKTNIKCNACVEKVTPALDKTAGHGNWNVDLLDPQRILTINAASDSGEIIKELEKVGYRADKI
jgi:copper chaperone CopZ